MTPYDQASDTAEAADLRIRLARVTAQRDALADQLAADQRSPGLIGFAVATVYGALIGASLAFALFLHWSHH